MENMQAQSRLSLTKSQRQTAIGAELISLCQTITEDGSLSDQEIEDLQKWLAEHRASDFPSIDFLAKIVEGALADKKVTKEECQSIYKAIEKILPADIRRDAVDHRRTFEAEERNHLRQAKEEERTRGREEREKNRPLSSWNFMVAGVRYEGRPAIIYKYVRESDAVSLQREYSNKYSRNAIAVYTKNGMLAGYVPEEDAVEIAPLLDAKGNYRAYFTKVLTEGRSPIPVVQANFYRDDATIPQVEAQSNTKLQSNAKLWIYGLIALIILYWIAK